MTKRILTAKDILKTDQQIEKQQEEKRTRKKRIAGLIATIILIQALKQMKETKEEINKCKKD